MCVRARVCVCVCVCVCDIRYTLRGYIAVLIRISAFSMSASAAHALVCMRAYVRQFAALGFSFSFSFFEL